MRLLVIAGLFFMVACNNKVSTPSNMTATVTVNFGFLDQIRQLCEDEYATASFDNDHIHRKVIADCMIAKLSLVGNSSQVIGVVNNKYCQAGADLSTLTPTELEQVAQICSVLK